MDEETLRDLLTRAQRGESEARNALLAAYRKFIADSVNAYLRHASLKRRNDELSVGMIAFDEAVTRFQPERGVPFLAFARLVIKSRLANYLRQEARHREAASALEVSDARVEMQVAAARDEALWEAVAQDRAEEIRDYEKLLAAFGITIEELVALSPKHADCRASLIRAATLLAQEEEFFHRFATGKRLPLREMARRTGLSPKVICKHRKYLLALAIIFREPERFIYLHSYLKGLAKGRMAHAGNAG